MALIPADMALRMQQQPYAPTAPAYNQLSLLDQQMKSILETSNLSPEQKLQNYYNSLRRFGEIQNSEIRVPIPVKIQPDESVESRKEEEDVGLPIRDSELLSRVSKHKRRGAKLLLDYIRKNPEVEWNDANELIYRGQRIPNSNIYDLIIDFSEDARKKQKSPRGWKELGEALSIQNVPRGAIGNRARQELFYTPDTSWFLLIQIRKMMMCFLFPKGKNSGLSKRNLTMDRETLGFLGIHYLTLLLLEIYTKP